MDGVFQLTETDARTLVIKRRFAAPRSLVWKVWTDPDHIAAWWGPFGPDHTTGAVDLTVGGTYFVSMKGPDGTEHACKGVIEELVPEDRLVVRGAEDATDACGAGFPPGASISMAFSDDGDGTLLTIITRFTSEAARKAAAEAGLDSGWRGSLAALEERLQNLMKEDSSS